MTPGLEMWFPGRALTLFHVYLIPSTHWDLPNTCNSSSRGSNALFRPLGALHAHGIQTYAGKTPTFKYVCVCMYIKDYTCSIYVKGHQTILEKSTFKCLILSPDSFLLILCLNLLLGEKKKKNNNFQFLFKTKPENRSFRNLF